MIEQFRNWYKQYFSDPQIVILFTLLIIGFMIILLAGNMLVPVFAAIVIAYLLDGLISNIGRLKIPRNIALPVVFIIFMIGLLAIVTLLLPMLSKQIAQMLQELPSLIVNSQKELKRMPERYPELFSQSQVTEIIAFLKSEISRLGKYAVSISIASVKSVITLVVYLVLVPLLVFFFLKDKLKILEWFRFFLPENIRLTTEVWHEVNQQVSNYVRGKIWEIIVVWVVSYITFTLLGLKFSLLVSLAVGLSVLAPYIGATVMFFPVVMVGFFQWGFSYHLLWLIIAYLILQALDGNLLAPLLLSGVVDLHPIAIIVALLIFGGIWGLWGLFFAIPLATLVHAVLKTWVKHIREINNTDSRSQENQR